MTKLKMLLFALIVHATVFGQDRFSEIKQELDTLATHVPALSDSVTISVNGVTFQDFIRAIAVADGVNINVDPNINQKVVNNFTNVQFKDVLFFIIKEYDLDIEIIGNIISLSKYKTPPPAYIPPKPKQLKIDFNRIENTLSLDLRNDSLINVTRKITELTGQNIIIPELENELISCYIKDLEVKKAIDQLANANNLAMESTKDGVIILSNIDLAPATGRNTSGLRSNRRSNRRNNQAQDNEENGGSLKVITMNNGLFSIEAHNAPLDTVVKKISKLSGIDYHILTEFEGDLTIKMDSISYQDFISHIFKGTDYMMKEIYGKYLLGKKDENDLKNTELLQLQYRSVADLNEFIPSNIKDKLEIIEFVELNGFLVSGGQQMIQDFKSFIMQIDKLVPVVLIEIMIIDVKDFANQEMGLKAGRGEVPESAGKIFPSFDVVLDGKTINKTLDQLFKGFSGASWLNLGRVGEDFYIHMNAMEENGKIKVRSTPKLSTLNGHEATLTTGETRYYAEDQSSLISTQSIYETNRRTYKSVNADFTITIKPFVSGDDYITLEVDVSQSDFVDPYIDGAPPGSINRSFKSMVRVKNQELILLGGLDKKSSTNSGEGVPFLSKIPVLKWFFSNRTSTKNDQKLSILIKPTIVN